MKTEYSSVLVELDCLLDTRLSTINHIDPDFPISGLASYHERKIDEFEGIPFDKFREVYASRDKSFLKDAVATPVTFLLVDFIKSTLSMAGNTPFTMLPKIVVNTFPYVLTESETDVIIASVKNIVNSELCEVSAVSMSPAEITPEVLRENFSVAIMYEVTEWLEQQSLNGNLQTKACPEVTIICPALFFKKNDKYDLSALLKLQDVSAIFVDIKLHKVDCFCFMKPMLDLMTD